MKGKVIKAEKNQYPPFGSIGKVMITRPGKIAFIPDNKKHYPPGTPPDEFDFYELEIDEVEILNERESN